MRPRWVTRLARDGVAALALLAAPMLVASAGAAQQTTFPHARHAGLFPTCTGCHGGIPTGDSGRLYPGAEACAACHDGVTERAVAAPDPTPRQSNLDFSHPVHDREAGPETPDCVACHTVPGAETRMDVRLPTPDTCLGCHAHRASSHLAEDRDCRTCHRPLTRAPGLSPARIAAFPAPETHGDRGFLLDHDPGTATARCATCHARESCARCHLNGDALSPVQALGPDPRVEAVEKSRAPVYPRPPSHADDSWSWEHGEAVGPVAASCANCHVRSSCVTCHGEGAPAAVATLPDPAEGDIRGVRLEDRAAVHAPGYALDHGPAAAAGDTCTSCHRPASCEACHADAGSPAFHLDNFLERHGPEAYGAATDCASCHDAQVFCRACHQGVGLGDIRRAGVTAHTSRPFWLVGHGQAARQGLAGCVTCHDQGDCATCHSAAFGWRVNPHGPGFDPVRSREANPFSCARCHRGGGG